MQRIADLHRRVAAALEEAAELQQYEMMIALDDARTLLDQLRRYRQVDAVDPGDDRMPIATARRINARARDKRR